MEKRRERLIRAKLKDALKDNRPVLMHGGFGLGMKELGRSLCPRSITLKEGKALEKHLQIADIDPLLLINRGGPYFIEEGGEYPSLLLARKSVLLSTHIKKATGFEIRPRTLFEDGFGDGRITLRKLFNGEELPKEGYPAISLEELASFIHRGGLYRKGKIGLEEVIQENLKNIAKLAQIDENIPRFRAFIEEYSRHIGTIEKNSVLLSNLKEKDPLMAESSFYDIAHSLRRLHFLDEVPAYCPPIKAKATIRRLPKKEMLDPAIATLLLGLNRRNILLNATSFQTFFEALLLRDLKTYALLIGGELLHYEDRSGLRIDAIIKLKDGRYGLIQIRLGEKAKKEGYLDLLSFRRKVISHDSKHPEEIIGLPSFMAVLTLDGKCRVSGNGVIFLPIGGLGA